MVQLLSQVEGDPATNVRTSQGEIVVTSYGPPGNNRRAPRRESNSDGCVTFSSNACLRGNISLENKKQVSLIDINIGLFITCGKPIPKSVGRYTHFNKIYTELIVFNLMAIKLLFTSNTFYRKDIINSLTSIIGFN